MARFAFKLPDMGEGTTEAELVVWHIKVGDVIAEDQPIVDVMTDKATVEIPAPVSGKVLSIVGEAGQVLAVGTEILVLETDGDSVSNASDVSETSGRVIDEQQPAAVAGPVPAVAEVLKVPSPAAANQHSAVAGEKPVASPSVRMRAKDRGVLLQFVRGTGPGARITHSDLDDFLNSGGMAPSSGRSPRERDNGVTEVKIAGLRRVIAERMQDAKRRIPHFSYIEEVDVTDLEDARAQLNARWEAKRPKLTLLPFLIAAIRKTIVEYPEVNACFDDNNGVIARYNGLHVGVATQTPQGLMVPVIRHAEALDLWEIADQIQRLSKAARDGKSTKDQLSGSTITITSLGSLGGLVTTPIINAPEVAIVGVNKILSRPTVQQNEIQIRKMMNLSSSFDHRVIDGVVAANFIQGIRGLLESPTLLVSE